MTGYKLWPNFGQTLDKIWKNFVHALYKLRSSKLEQASYSLQLGIMAEHLNYVLPLRLLIQNDSHTSKIKAP